MKGSGFKGLGLQLTTALNGSFDEEVAAGRVRTENALTRAVFAFTDEIQEEWRGDVQGSGLRNTGVLTKTIRSRHYRNSGLNAAGLVYSNFTIIQRAFEADTVVRSPKGAFLLIPNPDVWPDRRVRLPPGRGGRTTTLRVAERAFGKLRMVYLKGEPSRLVATRGGEEVVVFFLVKQARLPRMLRGKDIRARAERRAPDRVQQLFVDYFERDAGAPATGASR